MEVYLTTERQEGKTYELTEQHHAIMRLLCDGNNRKEIAALLRKQGQNITDNQVDRLLQWDVPHRSIFYRLSMLIYDGKREIRDQALAVHLYTAHYYHDRSATPPTLVDAASTPLTDASSPLVTTEPDHVSVVTTLLVTLYVCCVLFLFVPAWIAGCDACVPSYLTNLYFLIPLAAGISGLVRRKRLPVTNDSPYKLPFTLFSLGLMAWGIGNIIYLWRGLEGDTRLYPSYPDFFYIPNSLAWVIGMSLIYNSVNTWPKSFLMMLLSVALGGAIVLLLVMLSVRHWEVKLEGDPLKLVLDIAYPLLEVVNFTLFFGLIHNSPMIRTMGIYTPMRLLSVGMLLNFLADVIFSITTSHPTDSVWGHINGSWADLLFATAFCILGIGIWRIPLTNHSPALPPDNHLLP